MATEKLNPNGYDNGWPLGFLANVDEPVASADGQLVASFIESEVVVFDFPAVADIDDDDIVSSIAVTLRCRYTEGDEGASSFGGITAEILIGGISQGSDSTGNLSSGFQNKVLGNVGWNSDWTQAQLDSLQLRLTTVVTSGTAVFPGWLMDCVDVDITYVDVPSHTAEPAAATLTIATEEPVAAIPGQEHVAAGSAALTGQAPMLDYGVPVAKQSLFLAGTLSYANPVTEQLQINGWDNGWPTGFVANVDEPSAIADGQTVSTSGDNVAVVFDLDNVSVDITDETDVLSVSMTLRSRMTSVDDDPFEPGVDPGYLEIDLIIDGFSQGTKDVHVTENTVMANYSVSLIAWNQDWSVAQLNAMQVRVTTKQGNLRTELYYIDTIDVLVKHAAQSPIIVIPAAAALTVATTTSVIRRDLFKRPLVNAAVLAGKVLTLMHEDQVLPSAVALALTGKPSTIVVNYVMLPAVDALVLTSKVPIRVKDTAFLPAKDALVLASEVPTLDQTEDHVVLPAQRPLQLSPEAPLSIGPGQGISGPSLGTLALAGEAPAPVITANFEISIADIALTLAGQQPLILDIHYRAVPKVALLLSEKTPVRWPGTILPVVAAGSLAITTYAPEALIQFARLSLVGYVPKVVVDHHALPASLVVTINGQEVIVENASIHSFVGTLNFTGLAPTMGFSSFLSETSPRLINLTIDRDIEFIATPTDILIE